MTRTRSLFLAVLSFALVMLSSSPALAHVDLDAAYPAAGSTVESPLTTVRLTFTQEASPAETGVELLDGSSEVHVPVSLESVDGVVWEAEFDGPIAPGEVAVRWTMRAGDAHPRTGAFTFDLVQAATFPHGDSAGEEQLHVLNNALADELPTDGAEADVEAAADARLQAFLDADVPGAGASRLATAGRILAMLGAVLGVGALAFAASVLRGTPRDVQYSVFWIRRFGVLTAVGALVELAGQTVVDASGNWAAMVNPLAIAATLASGIGLAIALRLIGGTALTAMSRISSKSASEGVDVVDALAQRLPVGVAGGTATLTAVRPRMSAQPARLHRSDSTWAFVAAAALVVSFAFDGHTATVGHSLLTALADAVHVFGAAVWAGGVVMMALVARHRQRESVRPDVAVLAVRFSVLASIAVVLVGVAGMALTVTIIEQISDLWTTSWGRLILLKLAVVGVAGLLGFQNHHTLIPKYADHADQDGARVALRRAMAIEAVVLLAVIVITAFLVGASST